MPQDKTEKPAQLDIIFALTHLRLTPFPLVFHSIAHDARPVEGIIQTKENFPTRTSFFANTKGRRDILKCSAALIC